MRANNWAGVDVSKGNKTSVEGLTTTPINYKHQQDALNVVFDGKNVAQLYLQTVNSSSMDKNAYVNANATLQFDIRMHQLPVNKVNIAMHCQWPCLGEVNIKDALPAVSNEWSTIKIPLSCFVKTGMDFTSLNQCVFNFLCRNSGL
ncbi:putative glycoside hydrolase [Psychromonas sp. KJ10-10]|uniref:putative glycoside hydrolase n=1 Tax=Psychromonas sp. KJ10-10 TaxID=3391823 RepID=UPI0039B6D224